MAQRLLKRRSRRLQRAVVQRAAESLPITNMRSAKLHPDKVAQTGVVQKGKKRTELVANFLTSSPRHHRRRQKRAKDHLSKTKERGRHNRLRFPRVAEKWQPKSRDTKLSSSLICKSEKILLMPALSCSQPLKHPATSSWRGMRLLSQRPRRLTDDRATTLIPSRPAA